jgi:hypothetical protein
MIEHVDGMIASPVRSRDRREHVERRIEDPAGVEEAKDAVAAA